jgi:hypothetical protein
MAEIDRGWSGVVPPPEQDLQVWLCVWFQGKRFLAPSIVTEELWLFLRNTLNEELHVHHFLLRIEYLHPKRHRDLIFPDTRVAYTGCLVVCDVKPGWLFRSPVAVTAVLPLIRHHALPYPYRLLIREQDRE